MTRHVPNLLTFSRLLLAGVFFALLSRYQHEMYTLRGHHSDPLLLNVAFLVYIVALFTDFLDGYLARRWHVSSAFGRMTDPFVDKVLVLGSFIFFAGKNFVIPQADPYSVPNNVKTITGVVPWMVVLILARELLVTTFRGASEAAGQNFGAAFSGKLKMTLQSFTILVILAFVNFRNWLQHYDLEYRAAVFRDVFIWATLVVTVYSGLLYVKRAAGMFSEGPTPPAGDSAKKS